VEFPASRDDLMKRAGDQEIEYRKGEPVLLRGLLEDLDEEDFPSMANVVAAVSDALHEEGLTGAELEEERESP
jgi:hypothetical protein